jgi:hypothetical protein
LPPASERRYGVNYSGVWMARGAVTRVLCYIYRKWISSVWELSCFATSMLPK